MPFFKRKQVVFFLVMAIFGLMLGLPGCKEGTQSTPVSSLITGLNQNQATIDVSTSEDAVHVISGNVSTQNSSQNLSNIDVKLLLNKQIAGVTKTTSDGQFYFAKLPPGLYELEVSSSDGTYKQTNYIVRILEDGKTQPTSPVISLELANPGTAPINAKIEGDVIDSNSGTKLSNMNVELIRADGSLHSTALTNSNGYFAFEGLSNAEVYTINAGKASNYVESQQNVTIRNDGVVSPRYLIMRLSTKPIEKFTISGSVKSSDNKSIVNAEVKIFDDINLSVASAQPTRTTGDGKFFFDSLNEARIYYIKVSESTVTKASEIYPVRILSDGTTSPAIAEVFVQSKDTVLTFNVSGKALDVFTGGPLEYANVKIENNGSALTDKNGLFIAKNLLPGIYTVSIEKYGYEVTKGSFEVTSTGTTKPTELLFPVIHALKTGYGSIAGRFMNVSTGKGVPSLFVRLYKWVLTTKKAEILDYVDANNVPHYKTITETDYEYVPPVILTSKTSAETDANVVPEYTGSFKLTHLEPGKYLVYLTSSSSEPAKTTENRGGYFSWNVPAKALDAGFQTEIRALEVVSGQTTFWTNYEQEYK